MPYLSHSQTETWTQCPKRWALQRIEGAPQAPSEALILGSAVHAVIEADGRNIREGAAVDIGELLDAVSGALDSQLALDDPNNTLSNDTTRDMYAKAVAIIRAYVEHLQPRYAPLVVEESFSVAISGAPGWRFIGRIDARGRTADGSLCIIDFKTGKSWDRGAEHTKAQASAYIMAESVKKPLAQAQAVCFVVFPVEPDGKGGYTCRPQFRLTTRTSGQIDAYARYLVATAEEITAARQSGKFPAKTGPLCGWCGVLGSCRDGQAWLASKGRKPAIPMVSKQKEESEESA